MKSFVWLDEKSKKLTWWNRNYYFVTTIFVTILNIVIFASWKEPNVEVRPNWDTFSVANLIQALLNTYWHFNWQHVLLNMLAFFVAGLFIERQKGSLKFFLFIVIMSLFTAFATGTNYLSVGWVGFSCMNYGLFSYIIIDVIFMLFQKDKRYLFNFIIEGVYIALIYFAMCFCGGTKTVSYTWYPYDLFYNLGHASGFVVGILFGLYEEICYLISKAKPIAERKRKW